MTEQELLDRVQDLEEENQQLRDLLDAVADLVNGDDDDDEDQEEEEEKDEDEDENADDGTERYVNQLRLVAP
jgi:hypothetical protein